MEREQLTEIEITPKDLFQKEGGEYLDINKLSGDDWYIERCYVIPLKYTSRNIKSGYSVDIRLYIDSDDSIDEITIKADDDTVQIRQIAAFGTDIKIHPYGIEKYNGLEELCQIITEMLSDFKHEYYDEAVGRWKDKN
jgi:hypothetical protein